jgi:hypothetical protein
MVSGCGFFTRTAVFLKEKKGYTVEQYSFSLGYLLKKINNS